MCKETGSGNGAFSSNVDSFNINGAIMVQDFICICSVIATHLGEGCPVGAAEVMHEPWSDALPHGAPGPRTKALTCSS